jgi:probable metal-binding protein
MSNKIHGHEVMEMMIASGKLYTRDSLRADIIRRFGEATRFYTCSAEGMTADELISFLQARGKFLDEKGGFKTDKEKMCDD